ncbi:alpha/beta family hydrolase [Pontibacter sp. G13]|uniref:alpha/beta hydrolase family protein n=1 Tax=Pontibacter sp. G13 TaxID=3074898 RepID=UPI00288A815C|nr:alpha/beta family hydrolase [Pontibacter sp. G13]WNJ16227.1 alpha/beta family hydrolase [Pontibacter sp. G13]
MFTATPHSFISTPEKGNVSALLVQPPESVALLVLGHGAGAGMSHENMEGIAQAMGQQGIATLRYQFPYMERGGGRDSEKVSLATVHSAVQYAHGLDLGLKLLAGGHSFGGRMTSIAAAQGMLDPIEGLVFCNFPLHAPGKPSTHRAAHLTDIKVPMLFLSGNRDTFAQPPLLTEVMSKIQSKAQLHWLDTVNHGYKILKRKRVDAEPVFDEMARVTREWLGNQ